jgi:hypothetical protein
MEILRCCPRISTRAPHAGIWTSSMFSSHLIYNRRCLLMFGSLCRDAFPHCQACSGYSDHDVYPPAINWGIESSSSAVSPYQDSADDYPEIGKNTCGDSDEEGRFIVMVAPAGGPSHNSSSRNPTIGRSETSDARMTNDGIIQNLNPDFNDIRLQTIMESIEDSPLVALAQQGAEVANDRPATLEENRPSATDQTIREKSPK